VVKRQLEDAVPEGLAIVISCYQATTSEDTSGWNRLSVIL
jgi:hypothetical protein